MQLSPWTVTVIGLLAVLAAGPTAVTTDGSVPGIDEEFLELDGEWIYVEDVTEGRAAEDQGPPMSPRLRMRVEEDALVWVRPRHEERMHNDGSTVEAREGDYLKRATGTWRDGLFEWETQTVRAADGEVTLVLQKAFEVTPDGMLVHVAIDPPDGHSSVALYQHPEDIELPEPAPATIDDVAWIAGDWIGTRGKSSLEERWSPPAGGAMLGVSRTIKNDRMSGFEYLRIVERDGGLVYVAQPGGRSPTEYVLTSLTGTHAVFENPRHDSPQRIRYELVEGKLTASIGFMSGGRPTRFEFQREGG